MKKPPMIKQTFTSVVFSVIGFYLLSAIPTQALTLIPPSFEIDLTPGTSYSETIKLFNETDRDVTLYTEITNFTASEDGSKPQYEFGLELTDVATWIDVQSDPITLAPKERKDIPFTINTPADAEAGGHYAIIFFSDNPPQKKEAGKIQIGSKLGTLVLARVAGEVVEAGEVTGFAAAEDSSYFNHLPVELQLTFNNSGNVHLRPSGSVDIKNTFGKTVATIDVNAENSATLPNSARQYNIVWEKAAVEHTTTNWFSKFWEELKNEQTNFAFGRYTATATVLAGQSNQITQTMEVGFWVIPWRLLLVYGLGGIVLIFGLMRLISAYNRWIIKRGQSK